MNRPYGIRSYIYSTASKMKFCSLCGASVELRIPPDDNRTRHVCTSCGEVHYQNPKLIVGAIPGMAGQDPAVPPRHRTAPRTVDAARRLHGERRNDRRGSRARNAGGSQCAGGHRRAVFAVQPTLHQSGAPDVPRQIAELDFSPGVESLEVRLFDEQDIPWDTLAFRAVRFTLQHYFADRRNGTFRFRTGDIPPP